MYKYLTAIIIILICVSCNETGIKTLDLSNFDKSDYVKEAKIDISIPYQDGESLKDLGLHLGFAPVGAGGTSCFGGGCHNVEKGGAADLVMPNGGSLHRKIKSNLISKHTVSNIKMPFDEPALKSPPFVNNVDDTLVLWSGVPSQFVFEEQGRRGTDAHDMDPLLIFAENDFLSRSLHVKAFGHDTITNESLICAIAAFEQSIVSDQSNIAKGIITVPQGFKLFESYGCNSCHGDHRMAPSLAPNPILDHVKTPDLASWTFSVSDFHNQTVYPWYQNRFWHVIKAHRDSDHKEYDSMNEISYQDARAIQRFIKFDVTDYEMDRFVNP